MTDISKTAVKITVMPRSTPEPVPAPARPRFRCLMSASLALYSCVSYQGSPSAFSSLRFEGCSVMGEMGITTSSRKIPKASETFVHQCIKGMSEYVL